MSYPKYFDLQLKKRQHRGKLEISVKTRYNVLAVIVEAPISLGLETQVFACEDCYGHYREIGGILDEESYKQAFLKLQTVSQNLLQNPDNGWWEKRFQLPAITQATRYTEIARVKLSPQQKFLNCFLGAQLNPNGYNPEDNTRGVKPWFLDDQHLLAEVFLMTNDIKNLHKFKAAYPVVFPPKYTPLTRV